MKWTIEEIAEVHRTINLMNDRMLSRRRLMHGLCLRLSNRTYNAVSQRMAFERKRLKTNSRPKLAEGVSDAQ